MLNAECRREVCFHEAGHAIVHALGGAMIHRLAVAPEGATEWSIEGRKQGVLADLWGVCQASDLNSNVTMNMRWCPEQEKYITNRKGMLDIVKLIEKSMPGYKGALERELRSQMYGFLAGPIATQIYYGHEVDVHDTSCMYTEGGDVAVAMAVSNFLPRQAAIEYDHAAKVVEGLLRQPDVWAKVTNLAERLEEIGDMAEKLEDYLPEALADWPTAPPARK